MSRFEPKRDYEGVLPGIDEHYWHPAEAKGYWSVIKPYDDLVTNIALNPSLESNANLWVAINGATALRSSDGALHGSQGEQVFTTVASQGVGYQLYPQYTFNTPYSACISVSGTPGTVATFAFEFPLPPGSTVTVSHPTSVVLPDYPVRICATLDATSSSPVIPSLLVSVRFDRAGEYKVDGLVITQTATPVEGYFDGDSPNASWNGAPHASTSVMTGFGRVFGEKFNLNENGFNFTAATGFGLTPRQLITSPFARLNGAHLQRVKDLPRVIMLTGTFEGDPSDLHEARNELIEAMIWRFKNQCVAELMLCYSLVDECGCQVSPELRILAEYQGGLEGAWGTLDRERVTLIFACNSQQSFEDEFDSVANLALNGTTIIDYEGTDDVWAEVHMWPGAGGMNVSELYNDTIGAAVLFGTAASGGNPTALPLAFGQYAILRTNPQERVSLDLYASSSETRVMHYIRYTQSQVGLMRLIPGDNQFRVVVPLNSTGSRVFLRWRNRYLSVDGLCAGRCVESQS